MKPLDSFHRHVFDFFSASLRVLHYSLTFVIDFFSNLSVTFLRIFLSPSNPTNIHHPCNTQRNNPLTIHSPSIHSFDSDLSWRSLCIYRKTDKADDIQQDGIKKSTPFDDKPARLFTIHWTVWLYCGVIDGLVTSPPPSATISRHIIVVVTG